MSTDEYDLTISDAYRTPGRRRNNFEATVSPTVDDDEATGVGDGYEVGSVWIDTVLGEAWTCVDATSGAAVWVQGGGGSGGGLVVDLSVSGAHTADYADGTTHDLTLTGNTTLTPAHTTPSAGEAYDLIVIVRQDATGSRTLGFGGAIEWAGDDVPVMPTGANDAMILHFKSTDDAVSWFGWDETGTLGIEPATTVESETTFGISPAVGTDTEYARQDHTHGTPTAPAAVTGSDLTALGARGELVITSVPAGSPLVFADIVQDSEGVSLLYAAL